MAPARVLLTSLVTAVPSHLSPLTSRYPRRHRVEGRSPRETLHDRVRDRGDVEAAPAPELSAEEETRLRAVGYAGSDDE